MQTGHDRARRAVDRLHRLVKTVRHRARHPQGKPRTVLVAGVQRSGTNLLMQVLDRLWETEVFHETDPRAFRHYEMRSPAVIDELVAGCRAQVFVLKTLCELQDLSRLVARYPPCRALWMLRRYDDVVTSMLASFGNFAKQARILAVDRAGSGWRGHGMSEETQGILREAVAGDLNEASAAALMWYYRNILYFEQGLDHHPDVRVVHYEALTERPQQTLVEILSWLGLPVRPWAARIIGSRAGGRPARTDIHPQVRAHCDRLLARFEASSHAADRDADPA